MYADQIAGYADILINLAGEPDSAAGQEDIATFLIAASCRKAIPIAWIVIKVSIVFILKNKIILPEKFRTAI